MVSQIEFQKGFETDKHPQVELRTTTKLFRVLLCDLSKQTKTNESQNSDVIILPYETPIFL